MKLTDRLDQLDVLGRELVYRGSLMNSETLIFTGNVLSSRANLDYIIYRCKDLLKK